MPTDWSGRVVGTYRIVEKIGEGGMGAVYRAVDQMLDREVALKAVRPAMAEDGETLERFRTEAKLAARLSHPAIATIYSFFEEPPELFLAMEFVRGETLGHMIHRRGPLPWPEAVRIVTAALAGIAQAHRLGIVHRDLKPDNLMILDEPREGEGPGVKVMDFGIARSTDGKRLTRTGLLVGTLAYMAPEQIHGEAVDPRTDLYSLGIVLYEALTGQAPFQGASDFAILKAQVEDPPVPPRHFVADLPLWLEDAVLKALAKPPLRRFQSADEMRQALGAGVEVHLPLSKPSPSKLFPPPSTASRLRSPRAIAALILALVTIGIVFAARFGSAPRPEERAAAVDRPAPLPSPGPTAAVAPPPDQAPGRPAQPAPTGTELAEVSASPSATAPAPAEKATPTEAAVVPRGNLTRVCEGIVDSSSALYSAYKRFLGQKAKPSRTENQLKQEIASFEEVAGGLYSSAGGGFRGHMRWLRRESPKETRQRIGRQLLELKQAERKVETLMARVQPSPPVRKLWRQVRQQIRQAEALARR